MRGVETEGKSIKAKMDSISGVYDDLNEKMHDVDKTIKNNLLFYGMVPDSLPELPNSLAPRVQDLFRYSLGITRQLPVKKLARLTTGPEIRGCRPILVTFNNFKDREEVLAKAKLLKRSNIYVSEDLSRKTREHRHELQKFLRQVKTRSPNKRCIIRYDKLYIDNEPYVWDEEEARVLPARCVSPNRRSPSVQDQYRTGSALSVHDSHAFQRTPQPATLSRTESVHSVNGHPEPYFRGTSPSFGSTENLSLPPMTMPRPTSSSSENDLLNQQQVGVNLPHIVEEEHELGAGGSNEKKEDTIGEGGENGKKEKDVPQPTVSNEEQSINGNEAGDKAKKEAESKKTNGELIVDKNTQKILKSLSNGNGNKKPKK